MSIKRIVIWIDCGPHTGNEAFVTSDKKAAFVATRREAVAVAAMNEAVTISSKSAAAVVTLDQEEITINRRN